MIESFRQRLLVSNDGYRKANAEKGIQAHLDLVKKIQDGDIEGALKIAEALVRPSIPEFVVAAQNYSDPHTEGDE